MFWWKECGWLETVVNPTSEPMENRLDNLQDLLSSVHSTDLVWEREAGMDVFLRRDRFVP